MVYTKRVYKADAVAFGKCLLAIRKKKGLTRAQVKEKIGLNVETLLSYEHGKTTPGIYQLKILTDFYKVDLLGLYQP
jgi:transcriptional regulator with XRE-family HTH domain